MPLDIFGQGRPSQAALDYITIFDTAMTIIDQTVWEASIGSTNLFNMPAGGFGFAVGVLSRQEAGDFGVSGFAQQGLGRGVPVTPVGGRYQSDEIYGEVYVPLISEDMDIPLVSYLNVEGAYRYIDNDLAGTDDVWTVGFKYAPISDIEIRGNVTRSVRAPAINELFQPLAGTNSFAADPCDATLVGDGPNPANRLANCESGGGGLPPIDTSTFVSSVRNASVQGVNGGNLNLNNEVADAWTAGFVIRPRFAEGLQLSIDYLDFDITDAITSFTLTQLMGACYDADDFPNEFCGGFTRQANGQLPPRGAFVTGQVNAGKRVFKAYVSELLYSFDGLGGQWDISGSLQNIRESTRTLLGAETIFTGEIGNGAAEWQGNFRFRYSRDKWSAFLQPRFIGKGVWDAQAAPDRFSIPGNDDVWIWNTGFRYDFTDQIGAQVNINNLFDELPSPASIATGNDVIYDNVGRFFRVSLQIRL